MQNQENIPIAEESRSSADKVLAAASQAKRSGNKIKQAFFSKSDTPLHLYLTVHPQKRVEEEMRVKSKIPVIYNM